MVHHSPEMDIASIHFTAVVDPMIDLFSMIKTPIEVLITDIGFFEKIIMDILETSRYEQGLNPLILDSLIKVLLIPFLEKSEMNRENIRSYDPEFKNLLGYMSTNCEKELKISQLAESMHFHKNYFPSYFKKMTGKSPKRYIIDERIKRAKLLLLENRSSITEISDRLGFNDTCYFTRVFKEKTGMTPGTFAKQKVIL
jgi:AraC-like DNA-binding protein